MPRSFVFRIAIGIALIVVTVVGLSRVDSTKTPKHVEKLVSENALAQ